MSRQKTRKNGVLVSLAIIALASACNPGGTSEQSAADSTAIAAGREIFTQNCSTCHDFQRNGIGPALGGITDSVSTDWIRRFIQDPAAVIHAGDGRGKALFAQYKTVMPSFSHLRDEQLDQLIAYLQTQKAPTPTTSAEGMKPLKDPIPEPIAVSGLVVGAELVLQMPATSDKGTRTRITKLGFIPDSERLFMVDLRGKLYELRDGKAQPYLDMPSVKPDFIDKPGLATGFGSFAFHPEFLRNGLLYTGHAEKAGSGKADFQYADSIPVAMQWVISEWKTSQPGASPFEGESRELFRINMVSGMHGVQEMAFAPYARPGDENYGLLFIGIGDGSSVLRGYPFLVGSIENALGTIFRIDPRGSNSANGQYGIPPTNPFAQHRNPRAVKEIYAYGFRNPHRLSWTSAGQLLASNIGQANIDAVNLIVPGHNYGWPLREGTFLFNPLGDLNDVFPLPPNDQRFNYTYPVAQYDHDEGAAIIGGFEYTGSLIPELHGKYLFADMNNGRFFYFSLDDMKPGDQAEIREWQVMVNGKVTTAAELCGYPRVDLRLGQDQAGEFYFFSKQDGKVYRLTHVAQEAATL